MRPPRANAEGAEASSRLHELIDSLEHRPVSELSCHEGHCCVVARKWLQAMARAAASEFSPHPWPIAHRWRWGPTRWPIHWCEAVRAGELDCGALAEFSVLVFQAAGHKPLRVQLIQRFPEELTGHWVSRWRSMPETQRWIWGDLVYHEAVAIETAGNLTLWNPSESRWLTSEEGLVVALRLHADASAPAPQVRPAWGSRVVEQGRWMTFR